MSGGALDADPRALQFFFGATEQPCPYIDGRRERKAVTELTGPDPAGTLDRLSRAGFRRSHSMAYRPACPGCRACVPVRVAVDGFVPGRSQRRIIARNADLRAEERPPHATLEQYSVFKSYVTARHREGGMAEMSFRDYRSMVEDTPVDTRIVEFRDRDRRLVAAALTDWLADGLSGVYKYFAVERMRASPGTYIVLWHVVRARALGLPYVYLGYWIGACRKMAYKTRFQPLEALVGRDWRHFDPQPSGEGGPERVA